MANNFWRNIAFSYAKWSRGREKNENFLDKLICCLIEKTILQKLRKLDFSEVLGSNPGRSWSPLSEWSIVIQSILLIFDWSGKSR